jgi:hypothetical protein
VCPLPVVAFLFSFGRLIVCSVISMQDYCFSCVCQIAHPSASFL